MLGHGTLEEGIAAMLKPEILDGDDKWQMDDGEKVSAVRIFGVYTRAKDFIVYRPERDQYCREGNVISDIRWIL